LFQTALAVNTAKMVARLTSLLKLGKGTSLPGKVARKLDADILKNLASQITGPVIAVSGTNGKTTTCGLLTQMLKESGHQVANNYLGANMVPGITAALIHQSDMGGHIQADSGVLEVDEASLKGVATEVPIQRVLVTNLFRDQLDRYGELDTTAKLVAEGIEQTHVSKPKGQLILNADDPLVSGIAHRLKQAPDSVSYFGIEQVFYGDTSNGDNFAFPVTYQQEVADCPVCHKELSYQYRLYGHLGHYACPACGYQRPMPTICAKQVSLYPDRSEIQLLTPEGEFQIKLQLPGLFNVYNLLAAVAGLSGWVPLTQALIETALAHYQSVFGRAEKKLIDGKPAWVMLIKNPVGATEVLRLVEKDPKARLLIALNDQYADGRDVSWIWDAQFERLTGHTKNIVVSGIRACDMANRLKYAGIANENLMVESSLKEAVAKAVKQMASDETLYILPTYTALLDLRYIL
jgi:UDP-N-acetylmuramyl tripeptide synthase